MREPDFIGLGAQKSGSSWIYACLYEHPEICIPIKEIHFFSRERNWSKGYDWYESHFARCSQLQQVGEFSTTYLFDERTPERIYTRYPGAKLIVCLRNPMDRAFSNYVNDIKSGAVAPNIQFMDALRQHTEYIEQGRYARQLQRYFNLFKSEQLLILIYEDIKSNPQAFIQSIYRFIGVDSRFVPSLLKTRINVARIPRFHIIEKVMNNAAERLRGFGFDKLVWHIKKSRLPDVVRYINTQKKKEGKLKLNDTDRRWIYDQLRQDMAELAEIIDRDLHEWRL